jgi:hypothetical protein
MCKSSYIEEWGEHLVKMVPELILAVWFVLRALYLALKMWLNSSPRAGEEPIRIVITIELVIHVFTTVCVLLGSYFRLSFVAVNAKFAEELGDKSSWPPPYAPSIGWMLHLLESSHNFCN